MRKDSEGKIPTFWRQRQNESFHVRAKQPMANVALKFRSSKSSCLIGWETISPNKVGYLATTPFLEFSFRYIQGLVQLGWQCGARGSSSWCRLLANMILVPCYSEKGRWIVNEPNLQFKHQRCFLASREFSVVAVKGPIIFTSDCQKCGKFHSTFAVSGNGGAKVQVTGYCFTNTESIPNTCKS